MNKKLRVYLIVITIFTFFLTYLSPIGNVDKVHADVASAVDAVNAATDSNAMQAAIEDQALGLDLNAYTILTKSEKMIVLDYLIDNRGRGYDDRNEIQAALNQAILTLPVNNADLSNLTLNQASLSPIFAPDTTSYTADVDNTVSSIEVTAILAASKATCSVNGTLCIGTENIALNVGTNTISIVVTAQDGTTKTYTVVVTRDIGNAAQPTVTNATTEEDTLSNSGLIIHAGSTESSASTTHFKITNITGGELYKNDGGTPIQNDDFITVAEGDAGLKFSPDADANGTTGFGFQVQAAPGTDGTKLSEPVLASITVLEVNDAPVANNDVLQPVAKGTPVVTIPLSSLIENDSAGPANEADQILTITNVSHAIGGTAQIVNNQVQFTLDPSYLGTASFEYEVTDNGTTNGSDDFKMNKAVAQFDVVDSNLPALTLNGDKTLYLLDGQTYTEPGYAAFDQEDGDITNRVVVTGSVDTSTLGVYELTYNVKDTSNNEAVEEKRTIHVVSNQLSNLFIGSGTLTPVFSAEHESYRLEVPDHFSTIDLTPTVIDATATLTVNGQVTLSGNAENVPLHVGINTVTIIVTAQGGWTKTYTLEITRDLYQPSAPAVTSNDISNIIVGADAGMEYSTDGGNHWTAYDVQTVPTFAGNQSVMVRVKAITGVSTASPATTLIFTINPVPPYIPEPKPTESVRVVEVVIDDGSGKSLPAVEVEIKRTTSEDGLKIDTVALDLKRAQEAVNKAIENKTDSLQIVVTDLKDNPADQLNVKVEKSVLSLLKDHSMNLSIHTENGSLSIPTKTLSSLGMEDLYLKLYDVENKDLIDQTNAVVQMIANGAVVASEPVTVETNFKGRTEITLPIVKESIPTDAKARDEFIKSLAVAVQHSDGENKVYYGTIKTDHNGNPVGVSIWVNKFSTFTIISKPSMKNIYLDDAQISKYAKESVYRSQELGIMVGNAGKFNPQEALTRTQFTKVLMKALEISEKGTYQPLFKDVKNTHWAFSYIMKANELGFVKGKDAVTFHPNAPITRQQVAAIIGRALQLKPTSLNKVIYTDEKTISKEALPYVRALNELGILKGTNHSFEPNGTVTREMMATIVVRLLNSSTSYRPS